MAVFTWIPDRGFKTTTKPRVLSAKFGDGYEQRLADGINHLVNSWNLTFKSRSVTDAEDIDTFLTARGGVESFDFTPPGASTSVKVTCSQWDISYPASIGRDITATFVQVFEP